MAQYTSISILYNPHSSGDTLSQAKQLKNDLLAALPGQKIDLLATEAKDAARTFGYQLAHASKRPLILSVSGDGGYHEMLNGLLKAQAEGATPVAALVPGGNANDHYRSLHKGDFMSSVASQTEQRIDVFRLSYRHKRTEVVEYAHSYIGLGLTAEVGAAINLRHRPLLAEIFLAAKVFGFMRPIRLIIDNQTHELNSLTFSNIPRMAKFYTLATNAEADDALFEVTTFTKGHKFQQFIAGARMLNGGITNTDQVGSFQFRTVTTTLVQLDGEIRTIPADTTVEIMLLPRALRCIV